jgi:hypothetical protein
MNERIRELAEQAEISRLEYNSATMMTERIQEFDKAKFAELIVRECTSICAKQAWESRTNDDWTEYNALSRVAGQIKQHFGVEE